MEKLKSRIINTEITNFKNKTTGELNVMTNILQKNFIKI